MKYIFIIIFIPILSILAIIVDIVRLTSLTLWNLKFPKDIYYFTGYFNVNDSTSSKFRLFCSDGIFHPFIHLYNKKSKL